MILLHHVRAITKSVLTTVALMIALITTAARLSARYSGVWYGSNSGCEDIAEGSNLGSSEALRFQRRHKTVVRLGIKSEAFLFDVERVRTSYTLCPKAGTEGLKYGARGSRPTVGVRLANRPESLVRQEIRS